MFLQHFHQSDKSSHFIMLSVGLSMVLPGLFLLFVKLEASSIQSGSDSRISVAMHWSNNSAVNDAKKIVQNTSQKAIPELSPKQVLEPIQSPKLVESTQSIRPVEPKTKIEIPRVAKPILPKTEAQTKPALVKTELNVADILNKKGQNLVEQENLELEKVVQNKSLLAMADGQGESQTERYQIGSKNNPQPNYRSWAVRRGMARASCTRCSC